MVRSLSRGGDPDATFDSSAELCYYGTNEMIILLNGIPTSTLCTVGASSET